METPEVRVNLKSIEKELEQGLRNAELLEDESSPGQSSTSADVSSKLKLNVPKVVAKLVCDIKNGIEAKILSKDLDEDDKEFVRDFLKTSDKEIQLYQMVLEQFGTDFTPENYKEMLNRWLCNPLILLIEFEIERMLELRNLLKNLPKNKKTVAA